MQRLASTGLSPRISLVFWAPPLLALALAGCESGGEDAEPLTLDAIGEAYVKLVLAVGEHDDGYVDAYYGPDEWREAAARRGRSLDEIRTEAERLLAGFPALPPDAEGIVELRRTFLERQLESLVARIGMLEGKWLPFDEESEALYDARAPVMDEAYFEAVLAELDLLLEDEGLAEGSLIERYETFRHAFVIPPERLDAVFREAIDACRERTAAHIELPEGESFELEYVTDKTWSAYNWYQGRYESLIQVNTDLPVHIDRVLDLACHEGYPGHHVYNALLEKHLVEGRGWVEYQVYPLFSPQSLISEGSANFGREVAFTPVERLAFERDVLFPLAGLDPKGVEVYYEVLDLARELRYAGNDAARRYLDGEIDREDAVDFLNRYALMSTDRAEQRLKFIEKYRSYVINYNLGEDLVRKYIEGRGGTADDAAKRWEEFGRLLASPRLPSGLSAP